MDKIKVIINGKEVNPSEITFEQVIESILGKQYDDIPSEYNNPEDYLILKGLNMYNCDNEKTVADLAKKLKDRLIWVKKHKEYNLEKVKEYFNSDKERVSAIIQGLQYYSNAYACLLSYMNTITEETKTTAKKK